MNLYWVRRLHSMLGVIPIGIFLVFHLWVNSLAAISPAVYNASVRVLESMPYLIWIEVLVLLLPILAHVVIGLYIAHQAQWRVRGYTYGRNYMFYIQRITGIITLIFLLYHVWTLRVVTHGQVTFETVAKQLHQPLLLAFYLVGLLSTTFHFSNGLWNFGYHWGITIGPRSLRASTWVMASVFVILSAIGIRAIFAFV